MDNMTVGIGFDVHRLVFDRKLIIGGVLIDYEKGLLGHSDADVLVHAVMDALLGAAALGDIGTHFPDSNIKYKDVSSLILLEETLKILNKNGFMPNNIDATITAQAPKLSPYITDMRKNIAKSLKTDISKVNVKATTTEGLGFEGEGLGISAFAVCTLKRI